MKQVSSLWQKSGFALTTFGGTILHFLYNWTGGSILVSPFSGVNESTWEHMKLLFWPLALFALVQRLSDSTRRRLPLISSSLAFMSPDWAFSSSLLVSSPRSTGSFAVFTPQISTFPCIVFLQSAFLKACPAGTFCA